MATEQFTDFGNPSNNTEVYSESYSETAHSVASGTQDTVTITLDNTYDGPVFASVSGPTVSGVYARVEQVDGNTFTLYIDNTTASSQTVDVVVDFLAFHNHNAGV